MAYTAVKTRVQDRSGLLFSYLHQGKNMDHRAFAMCRISFSGCGHGGYRYIQEEDVNKEISRK